MKVLFALDSLYRGGAEMQALDVGRKAAANGLDLSVAAFGGGALEDEFRGAGFPFFRLTRRLPIDPFLIVQLRRLILREKFDIIHAHQAVDGMHAYLATMGTKVKRVLSFHGHIADAKNRLALRYLVPRMDANISCSRGLLNWLCKAGIDTTSNFQVIYNGVDPDRLAYDGPSLKTELGLPDSAQLIGMVAHFYPAERKDHLTLCRAFAKVANDNKDAQLIIVGRVVEGAEAKYAKCVETVAEAGLSDRVHFLGQRPDLSKIIDGIDVYVFSSLHEGLPIALMEAMLAGKPTILSDIEPHLEIAGKGDRALVFKTRDTDELADRLVKLLHSREKRNLIAEGALDFASRTFSIDAHLASLKEVYSSILSS